MEKKRLVYMDYLRLAAVFGVVILHTCSQNWTKSPVDSFQWQVFNAVDSMVRWAVPVFTMISGALFLGREQSIGKLLRRNVLRMAVLFLFWSTAYALFDYFATGACKDLSALRRALITGKYHLWYLLMIGGMYLVVPFLNQIIKDEKLTRWFLVLSFLFAFLIPQFIQLFKFAAPNAAADLSTALGKAHIDMVAGYTGYYVLGWWLSRRELSKKAVAVLYVLGILGIVVTAVGTAYVSQNLSDHYKKLYDNLTLNVLLPSAAIFIFAKRHWDRPIASERRAKLLRSLSRCTLGVYLLHIMILDGAKHFLHISTLTWNPLVSVPLMGTGTFLLALGVTALLRRIPIVRDWLI